MSSNSFDKSLDGIKSDTDERAHRKTKDENSCGVYKGYFQLAFENANVGMCLVNPEGQLVRVNRHMCDIFGYSKEEFEGMSENDITHPDFLDVSPNFISRASNGEVAYVVFQKKILP